MKFGLQYYQHKIAKWADHYIDYNGLRSRMRSCADADLQGISGASCNTNISRQSGSDTILALLEHFDSRIKKFEQFRDERYWPCEKLEEKLRARFQLPETTGCWASIAHVCKFELDFFQRCYEDILLELRDIQQFNAVNEAAIHRLFDNLKDYFPGRQPLYRVPLTEWIIRQKVANQTAHEKRQRIFEFIDLLRRRRDDLQSSSQNGQFSFSFGTTVLPRYIFPPSYDTPKLFGVFREDKSVMVEHVIRNSLDPHAYLGGSFWHLLGDLLILGMLLEAETILSVILERIMKEDIAISIPHVSVILAIWRGRGINTKFDLQLTTALCTKSSIIAFLPQEEGCGNAPLHYAARYGFVELCRTFAQNANGWDLSVSEAAVARDKEGMTPLHNAVLSRSIETFLALAQGRRLKTRLGIVIEGGDVPCEELEEVLLLAVRTKQCEMAETILKLGHNMGYSSFGEEVALYCAAQTGSLTLVEPVVRHMVKKGKVLDSPQKHTGWTPLMVACANGHLDVVSLLLSSGADPKLRDARGWTAQEHAAFRGHLTVAEIPTLAITGNKFTGPACQRKAIKKGTIETLNPGKKTLVVNIGSVQRGRQRAALKLRDLETADDRGLNCPPDTILELSAPNGHDKQVPLPILKDYTNEPFVCTVDADVPLRLTLKLYRREFVEDSFFVPEQLLCAGTVTLDHDKDMFGENRESMLRETTVFMMPSDTSMGDAGKVLLSYVVATAFDGLQSVHSSIYRRDDREPARLIGHRGEFGLLAFLLHILKRMAGLGQNTASESSLQIRENTALVCGSTNRNA